MKEYSVKITDHASADMEEIYSYIANSLHATDTARRQYKRIADEICSLRVFPNRNKLFDSQPEYDMGLRQLIIDNFSVVYAVEDSFVIVLRVLYSASDIANRLKENR